MARPLVHLAVDGWRGVLPDVPLALGILHHEMRNVPTDSMYFKLHKLLHDKRCCFVLSLVLWKKFHQDKIAKAYIRHVLIDHATHQKDWLSDG